MNYISLNDVLGSANTGLDAIRRAPIVENETNIRCMRIQDVSQKKPFNQWGYTEVSEKDFKSRRLKKNDILVARTGATVGVNFLVPTDLDAVYNNGLIRLRVDTKKYDSVFIYYVLQSNEFKNHIYSIAFGTVAQPNIKIKDLLSFQLPKIDIEKQYLISRFFQTIDKKIELNNQINDTLEAMAQAIFKSWFVDFDPVHAKAKAKADGLDAEGINRVAMAVIASKSDAELTKMKADSPAEYEQLKTLASLFPDQLEESELGMIPQGWEVSTIGKEYDVVMGQSPKGETYNESGEGTLFYQGRAEFGWRFPTPRLYTTDPKRMAKEGDILMSVRAPVGDFNIALADCCIGRGLSALRHKSGSSTFSFYQLLSLKPELDRYNGEGTVFGSINQTNLKKINCISPANNLVNHFVEKVSVLDKKIQSNTLENIALTELRDALLPKLLSGEIEV